MENAIFFSMKTLYEAWLDESDHSITFASAENIKKLQQAQNLLSKNAKLLHCVEADTNEEAHAVHHIKMG